MNSHNAPNNVVFYPYCLHLLAVLGFLVTFSAEAAIQYATSMEESKWETDSSKFICRLSHYVDGFGEAVFEREAGEPTRFLLTSKMPRMKTGQAALVVQPPAWGSKTATAETLSLVNVKQSMTPISLGRKLSEKMMSELEQGMLLTFNRRPWYGDTENIKVYLSSIGFHEAHQDYLSCLARLLPVNFKQVERSVFYYGNDDDDLTDKVKRRLDVVVDYVNADPSIQTFYLDGHTDSEGIRNENLLKSQRRTEKVMDYLVEKQISRDRIVARWHGERYPVSTNRTAKGRAKNRRVTLRLSKEPPQTLVQSGEQTSAQDKPTLKN